MALPRLIAAFDADEMNRRMLRLQQQLADPRGRRVVLVSHCLLNQNVRYLGGANRPAGFGEVADDYLVRGVGIQQLACPERRAWGGVLKRVMLIAFGAGGTLRAPLVRLLLSPFIRYTRLRYGLLARAVARDVADYRRSGIEVIGVVGVAESPSCGVYTTLNIAGAVDALTRCPLSGLDLCTLDRDVIAANVMPGPGLFTQALRQRLRHSGATVSFVEHDFRAGPVTDDRPIHQSEM